MPLGERGDSNCDVIAPRIGAEGWMARLAGDAEASVKRMILSYALTEAMDEGHCGLPTVPWRDPPTSVGEVGLGADQMWVPKFCAGSNSSPQRPVGNAAAPAWRARKRPEPGAARSVASSTTTRPRLNTVTGQPVTTRPS